MTEYLKVRRLIFKELEQLANILVLYVIPVLFVDLIVFALIYTS